VAIQREITMSLQAGVDGDVLVYRAGFAAETSRYKITNANYGKEYLFDTKGEAKQGVIDLGWEGRTEIMRQVAPEPLENCLHTVKLQLNKIKEATGADELVVYLSGSDNYRLRRATFLPYKGNRALPQQRLDWIAEGKWLYYLENTKFHGRGRPFHYDDIKRYMTERWDAQVCHWYEADDALAMAQTALGDEHIICTIDKDLKQVVGSFYNFTTDEFDSVDPLTAEMNLQHQRLTGDMCDCIYGIKGMGEKTAKKLLEGVPEESVEHTILCAYKDWFDRINNDEKYAKKKQPMDDALVSMYSPEAYMDEVTDLVRLLRTEDEYVEMMNKIKEIGI